MPFIHNSDISFFIPPEHIRGYRRDQNAKWVNVLKSLACTDVKQHWKSYLWKTDPNQKIIFAY